MNKVWLHNYPPSFIRYFSKNTETVTLETCWLFWKSSISDRGWYQSFVCTQHWHLVAYPLSDIDYTSSTSPQLVSLLLIGVAAWGKWFGLVSSINVVAGVICVGIFLFLVAFVGLCGALKHHQVLLFFVSFDLTVGRRMGSHLTLPDSCCLPEQNER